MRDRLGERQRMGVREKITCRRVKRKTKADEKFIYFLYRIYLQMVAVREKE